MPVPPVPMPPESPPLHIALVLALVFKLVLGLRLLHGLFLHRLLFNRSLGLGLRLRGWGWNGLGGRRRRWRRRGSRKFRRWGRYRGRGRDGGRGSRSRHGSRTGSTYWPVDNLDIGVSVIMMTSMTSVSAMVIVPVSSLVDNDSLVVVVVSVAMVPMSMSVAIDYHNIVMVIMASLVDMLVDVLVDIDISVVVVSVTPISIDIDDIAMVSVVSASIDVDDVAVRSVVAIDIDDIVIVTPLVHHNNVTSMSVAMMLPVVAVVSITINNDNLIIVIMSPLVDNNNIIATSMTVMSVVPVSSSVPAFINNNDITSRVDMLVNVLVTIPIVVIVIVVIVVVSMSTSTTFNHDDSVIVVSGRSSVQVQEATMDWAITSNSIQVDVDQLIISLDHPFGVFTHVVVVGGTLEVPSINIDKPTMSWAITFNSINVDVDHLQSSALGRCYRRTTYILLLPTLDRYVLLSVLGLGLRLIGSRLLGLRSLVLSFTLRLLGSCR